MEPAVVVRAGDAFQSIVDRLATQGTGDFVVVDNLGNYVGMVVADDITFAPMEREAIPLLTCADVVRNGLPVLNTTDDLGMALEIFAHHDVARLAVVVASHPSRVVGVVSRGSLMRRYQQELSRAG
jgi:CBS domain-containing protein